MYILGNLVQCSMLILAKKLSSDAWPCFIALPAFKNKDACPCFPLPGPPLRAILTRHYPYYSLSIDTLIGITICCPIKNFMYVSRNFNKYHTPFTIRKFRQLYTGRPSSEYKTPINGGYSWRILIGAVPLIFLQWWTYQREEFHILLISFILTHVSFFPCRRCMEAHRSTCIRV